MRKSTIGILLALVLILLLTGCAGQVVKPAGAGGAGTERMVQQEDTVDEEGTGDKEELPLLPETELYNIFDIAYTTYEIMDFPEEESIGYELYEVSKMLKPYGTDYIIPSDAEIEIAYRAWRSTKGSLSGSEGGVDMGDTGNGGNGTNEGEAGGGNSGQSNDTTPPPPPSGEQPPASESKPTQVTSTLPTEYNGHPIDTAGLEMLQANHPDKSVEEILSLFGESLIVNTPEQQKAQDEQAKIDAKHKDEWFGSN